MNARTYINIGTCTIRPKHVDRLQIAMMMLGGKHCARIYQSVSANDSGFGCGISSVYHFVFLWYVFSHLTLRGPLPLCRKTQVVQHTCGTCDIDRFLH